MFTVQRLVAAFAVVVFVALAASRLSASGIEAPDPADGQNAAVQDDASVLRAQQAYTQRLLAMAQAHAEEQERAQRAMDAWTARLNGLARTASMSQRAMDAWTARLNGLADHYANQP